MSSIRIIRSDLTQRGNWSQIFTSEGTPCKQATAVGPAVQFVASRRCAKGFPGSLNMLAPGNIFAETGRILSLLLRVNKGIRRTRDQLQNLQFLRGRDCERADI